MHLGRAGIHEAGIDAVCYQRSQKTFGPGHFWQNTMTFVSGLVRLTSHGDVAVVTIDNPPVNALSPGVPEGILARVKEAGIDPAVKAIVVIGAGNTFIAGADRSE